MKALNIAILSQLNSPTVTEQLAPVLRERGHTVVVVDVSKTPTADVASQPAIQSLLNYDLVYYRSGLETNSSIERIIQLEAWLREHSVVTVNLHYTEHPLANSKTYETKIAEQLGITTPQSLYGSTDDFHSIQNILGLPFVAKTNFGTQGTSVHLIKDNENFIETTNAYRHEQLLYQSFVPHEYEYRVHTISGEAVAMYKRLPPLNDFRTNVSLGGKMEPVETAVRKPLTQLAQKVAQAFDFEILAIDFMYNTVTNDYVFTEINLNAGWEFSDKLATNIDLSEVTADYFERLCI